jgi:UMF1 family MFS transporter
MADHLPASGEVQQTASRKVINGWAMYDWANSAYNLVITSTIFPAYFEAMTHGEDNKGMVQVLGWHIRNTALYNYALAVAFLVVALCSPLLSSIADYRGNKKTFLQFFLTLGSLACAGMFFFEARTLWLGIACMIIACIGYWSSLVFYNSFLPEIAAPQDRDRISAKGFMYGYVGSVILQLVCFVFVFKPELIGGSKESTIQFRLSFLLVGIWWWAFGQFALRRLPKPLAARKAPHRQRRLVAGGYKELQQVWKQLSSLPRLKAFLVAFFFYNMGVQTLMLAASLYGKSELDIPVDSLIISILIIQLIAIPGAWLIARLSARIGNLPVLMITVGLLIVACIAGYLLPRGGIYQFYALAVFVGFIMGGIQSLSRSTYSKLMPVTTDTTAFFSFYDVTEKIAIVIGMFSFGFINQLTGSQRNAVLSLVLFFFIGLVLLINANRVKQTGASPL